MQTLKQVAWAAFLFTCVFWVGFGVGEARQKVIHQDYVRLQQQAAVAEQQQLDDDLAKIALTHEEALAHEQQTIDDLRISLRAGSVRLRQAYARCQTNDDQRASLGDGERAEPDYGERELGQDVLDLAEFAQTAIAQRDALQAIIRKVNDEHSFF